MEHISRCVIAELHFFTGKIYAYPQARGNVSHVKNKFCMLSHMRDVFMQENMNKRVAHDPVF